MVQDLALAKELSEVLASRLNEKKMPRTGHQNYVLSLQGTKTTSIFHQENDLVYCNNVQELLLEMEIPTYNPQEWRLFLDSSKVS